MWWFTLSPVVSYLYAVHTYSRYHVGSTAGSVKLPTNPWEVQIFPFCNHTMMMVMVILCIIMLFRITVVMMFVFVEEQFNRFPWLNNSVSPAIANIKCCLEFSIRIYVSIASIGNIVWSSNFMVELSVRAYFVSIIVRIYSGKRYFHKCNQFFSVHYLVWLYVDSLILTRIEVLI